MKRLVLNLAIVGMLGLAGTGVAMSVPASTAHATNATALQTQVFKVEKMTCAACPITVKTAIRRLEGVRSVEVDFQSKTATVVFDPASTTTARIAQASADAGYPAHVAKG